MRLIRGIPVPRINPRARINHANRSDSPRAVCRRRSRAARCYSCHIGISGTRLLGGTRDQLAAIHDPEGSGTARRALTQISER
jgi:hypothetical protein